MCLMEARGRWCVSSMIQDIPVLLRWDLVPQTVMGGSRESSNFLIRTSPHVLPLYCSLPTSHWYSYSCSSMSSILWETHWPLLWVIIFSFGAQRKMVHWKTMKDYEDGVGQQHLTPLMGAGPLRSGSCLFTGQKYPTLSVGAGVLVAWDTVWD